MAQNGRSEGLACRPAGKRRQGNFSGRCSSGPKTASEWLKTTVLRPFPTALQGSATRVIFIKNRQRFTVSLPWASVLLVSKPSNLHTRGSIWASAGSAKRLQFLQTFSKLFQSFSTFFLTFSNLLFGTCLTVSTFL